MLLFKFKKSFYVISQVTNIWFNQYLRNNIYQLVEDLSFSCIIKPMAKKTKKSKKVAKKRATKKSPAKKKTAKVEE